MTTNQPTVCVLCSQNCGIRVDVEAGRITKVRPDATNPLTHGYMCNKAASVGRYADHAERVRHPLRRRPDGEFERVSWETAIADIAERLMAIRTAHGGQSIAMVGIGGQANHMSAAYALAVMEGLGSQWWFNAYAQEKTQNHLVDGWMFGTPTTCILHPDVAHNEYLLVLGTNPRISNRGEAPNKTLPALAADPDRTLVVVDPRRTETAATADLHLPIRPGGDAYLLLAMCATLVRESLYDVAFVEARCDGFETIAEVLRGLDRSEVAPRHGLDPDQVDAVARAFAAADGAGVLWDLGIEQGRFNTLNAYLIRLLLCLTGNLGRPGGNVWGQAFPPPDPEAMRRDAPFRAPESGIDGIRALTAFGMFSPSLFPEEVLTDRPDRIRAVIVEGANPLITFSETAAWARAFERLDLVVVIEPAVTETARLADYVLPTPVGYEKWEMGFFPSGFPAIGAQLRPPVLEPPPDALPEPEIYARLAEAMDLAGRAPALLRALARGADTPGGRARLIAATLALAPLRPRGARNIGRRLQARAVLWLYRLLGPHLPAPQNAAIYLICVMNALSRRAAVLRTLGPGYARRGPFALAEALWQRLLEHPEGVEVACLDPDENLSDHLRLPRARLALPAMLDEVARALAAPDCTSDAFPLVLSAGVRTRWTANAIHRDPEWRRGRGPHCPVFVHPDDATRLGLVDGDDARLTTPWGAARLPVAIEPRARPGHVAVPNGFGMRNKRDGRWETDGVNLNALTGVTDRDPFTGCPHHKHVPCRLSAVDGGPRVPG